MTTGEGGMLLIDDQKLFENCVKLRDLGRGPNTKSYFNEVVGYKFMPFNMQAALGLAQFERLDDLINIKRNHLGYYRNELSELDVQFNYEPEHVFNGAWITGMVLGKSYGLNKAEFIEKLKEKGIPARPFFYPLSSLPAFNDPVYANKNSYDISDRGINLPGAANLTETQLSFICNGIKQVLEN